MKRILLFTYAIMLCGILSAQPTAGLTGHFKFDNNLNNIAPTTMSATGSGISYSTNGAGAAAKAMMFGGTINSYVTVTDNGNLDFTGDFSIAFGIYLASTSANQGIYDNCLNYNGIGIWYFNADNTLRFNYRNGSIGALAALPAGVWRAVVAVKSGTTISLYVNGVLAVSGAQGTQTLSYPYPPVFGQMFFNGASANGNYNPILNGSKVDEFRFYNRALTPAEIVSLVGPSLPLNFGDFTAAVKPTGIQLNWETLMEQNTSHFDVEYSANAVDFTAIGKVNAKGNSTNKEYYSYTDVKASEGMNYYRLKMVDLDNSFTYSRIIAIRKSNDPSITLELFPNPVINVLNAQMNSKQKETAAISITDGAGKKVYSGTMQLSQGSNATSIPVAQLPKGTYYFSFENLDGKQSRIFIKQ